MIQHITWLFCGFLLVFPCAAWAQSAESLVYDSHPETLTCQQDSDCVVVPDICGTWRGVNRTYEEKVRLAVRYLKMATACKKDVDYKNKPEAICSYAGTCGTGDKAEAASKAESWTK